MLNTLYIDEKSMLNTIKDDINYYLSKETVEHSLRVANNCYNNLFQFKFYLIGLLHDLIEDTDLTINDLKVKYKDMFIHFQNEQFAVDVLDAVNSLTRRKDEKYFDYINRIKLHEDARKVKFFDLQDNLMRCMLNDNKSLKKRYLKALEIIMEN